MIDTGAVGRVITKSFLDSVGKDIESSTNIQIIGVSGARYTPLGIVRNIRVKVGRFEIAADMIVNVATGYNVLLGNDWINKAKATIDTKLQMMTIERGKEKERAPITCFIKMDLRSETIGIGR